MLFGVPWCTAGGGDAAVVGTVLDVLGMLYAADAMGTDAMVVVLIVVVVQGTIMWGAGGLVLQVLAGLL